MEQTVNNLYLFIVEAAAETSRIFYLPLDIKKHCIVPYLCLRPGKAGPINIKDDYEIVSLDKEALDLTFDAENNLHFEPVRTSLELLDHQESLMELTAFLYRNIMTPEDLCYKNNLSNDEEFAYSKSIIYKHEICSVCVIISKDGFKIFITNGHIKIPFTTYYLSYDKAHIGIREGQDVYIFKFDTFGLMHVPLFIKLPDDSLIPIHSYTTLDLNKRVIFTKIDFSGELYSYNLDTLQLISYNHERTACHGLCADGHGTLINYTMTGILQIYKYDDAIKINSCVAGYFNSGLKIRLVRLDNDGIIYIIDQEHKVYKLL